MRSLLLTLFFCSRFASAIAFTPYDTTQMEDGLRHDRLIFFSAFTSSSTNPEEEFLKKTIISKVLCQIDSPFAIEECSKLNVYYLAQKKIPRLTDFKLSAMSTKWILQGLAKIVRQVMDVVDPAEKQRLSTGLVLLGSAMAQNQELSIDSALKITQELDPVHPWFQIFLMNADFKAYLPFVEEALNWIKVRPFESTVTFIAPYTEAVLTPAELCFTYDGKTGTCQGLSLQTLLLPYGSTRPVDTNPRDALFSGLPSLAGARMNGAHIRSTTQAGLRLSEISKDMMTFQFSGASDHYCTFNGKVATCTGAPYGAPPIDHTKILQVFASPSGAPPYFCFVFLDGQSSSMNCWGQSPFPSLVKDVSYVIGAAKEGCVMGLSGFRCYRGGKPFLEKRGVTNAAIGDGELCTQSNSTAWECDGKMKWSRNNLIPGNRVEQLTTGAAPIISIDNRYLKFSDDLSIGLGTPDLPPIDAELFKGLHVLLKDKKIKSVLNMPGGASSYFLTEDNEFYSFNSQNFGRIENSVPLAKSLTTEISPKFTKEWPLRAENERPEMGVITFSRSGQCDFSKPNGCAPRMANFKSSNVDLSTIEGFLPNGCYFTKVELVCGEKHWPVSKSDITRVVELNLPMGGRWVPKYCISGEKPFCITQDGDFVNWTAKDPSFKSITTTNSYYCIEGEDRLACSDGMAPPWYRVFGKMDKIFYGRDSVVILEGTTLKQLRAPGSAKEKLTELRGLDVKEIWNVGDTGDDLFCFKTRDNFRCFGSDRIRRDASRGFGSREGISIKADTKIEVVEKDYLREICVEVSKTDRYCSGKYKVEGVASQPQMMNPDIAVLEKQQWPGFFAWTARGKNPSTLPPARIRWAGWQIESLLESPNTYSRSPCLKWTNGVITCSDNAGSQNEAGSFQPISQDVTFGVMQLPAAPSPGQTAKDTRFTSVPVACQTNSSTPITCKIFQQERKTEWNSGYNRNLEVPFNKAFDKVYVTPLFICASLKDELSCWTYHAPYGNRSPDLLRNFVTLTLPDLRQVVWGDEHVCALYRDGVKCFGSLKEKEVGPPIFANYGQADVPPGLGEVEWLLAGRKHTCAKVKEGLRCWGLWRKMEEANAQ